MDSQPLYYVVEQQDLLPEFSFEDFMAEAKRCTSLHIPFHAATYEIAVEKYVRITFDVDMWDHNGEHQVGAKIVLQEGTDKFFLIPWTYIPSSKQNMKGAIHVGPKCELPYVPKDFKAPTGMPHLVVNMVGYYEGELRVGATDNANWDSEANAGRWNRSEPRPIVWASLKIEDFRLRPTEKITYMCPPEDPLRPLVLKLCTKLLDIAWTIHEEGLDQEAAHKKFFALPISSGV